MYKVMFCFPDKAYFGLSEFEAAIKHRQFAIDGFDSVVKFREGYNSEIPDVEGEIPNRFGRDLEFVVFHNQPVLSVGGYFPNHLVSSNYLFGPKAEDERVVKDENLFLPGFDVVCFEGEDFAVTNAANRIKSFYSKEGGWEVRDFKKWIEILRVIPEGRSKERWGEREINIHSPEGLLRIAKEFGYDSAKVCWEGEKN